MSMMLKTNTNTARAIHVKMVPYYLPLTKSMSCFVLHRRAYFVNNLAIARLAETFSRTTPHFSKTVVNNSGNTIVVNHGHHAYKQGYGKVDDKMSGDRFCDVGSAMSMSMNGFIFTQKPDDPCYIFLLQHWVIDTYGKYIGAVLGTFVLVSLERFPAQVQP